MRPPIARLALLAALLACAASPGDAIARSRPHDLDERDPLVVEEGGLDAIPGRYIVVFKPGAGPAKAGAAKIDLEARHGAAIDRLYEHALDGFAGELSPAALDALKSNPDVALIEPDRVVQLDPAFDKAGAPMSVNATQSNATWGLDRIDQASLPLNTTYIYNYTGAGVRAYIIDTGIRTTHAQFGGRAQAGYTAISDGNGSSDCNGHGTHVAGTVGGSTYGVAKGVTLVAVRVLNCSGSGTNSGVIAGVDWVTGQKNANQSVPMVANMSLGGSASSALDTAVNNSINAGVVYAIAAGNSSANACNYSPARAAAAITVGSTTNTDARSSFSNYGTCLDIFAPGSSITSAWYTSDTAINTISGTSMAAPHVAGVAALYLQQNPGASAATARNAIVNAATLNKVTSPGTGSPNALLCAFAPATCGGASPTPTPPPPTPTPTPGPGGSRTFANAAAIAIPGSGAASPYASGIAVSGMSGSVSKVVVRLRGLSHTYPDDLDVLLVGPGGQKVLLMSDAGGGGDVTGITLTFDDAAAAFLADSATLGSGTFRPSNYGTGDSFPAPAPAGPYSSALSAFNGLGPNGTWSLYVFDDASLDSGSIGIGWELTVTTGGALAASAEASDDAALSEVDSDVK